MAKGGAALGLDDFLSLTISERKQLMELHYKTLEAEADAAAGK